MYVSVLTSRYFRCVFVQQQRWNRMSGDGGETNVLIGFTLQLITEQLGRERERERERKQKK